MTYFHAVTKGVEIFIYAFSTAGDPSRIGGVYIQAKRRPDFEFQPPFLLLYILYMSERSFEFLEETQVVLEVVAKVAHLPLEHRDTLNSHSEGKAAVLLAVDS